MKNLLLVLLFVIPTALFSASPSCLAGMEVSLVDSKGKVVKSGKLNNRGQLTLDGIDDAVYTIRVTNNGKSCVLDKPTTGSFRGLPTGKRMHKPVSFKLSDQKGGHDVVSDRDAASGLATGKRTSGDFSSGRATGKRQHKPITTSKGLENSSTKSTSRGIVQEGEECDDGNLNDTEIAPKSLDGDCDSDVGISVTSKGNGKVEIKVTKTK
jgi:hypothetical protein